MPKKLLLVKLTFLLLASSCAVERSYYPDLYEKTGFENNRRPRETVRDLDDSNSYYKPSQPYSGGGYSPPMSGPMPQSYYQPVPAPVQIPMQPASSMPVQAPIPMPPQAYQQQVPGNYALPQPPAGSRFYSNPYAIPPAGSYYAPRYDVDQYYVPPYYYNVEAQQNLGSSQHLRTANTRDPMSY